MITMTKYDKEMHKAYQENRKRCESGLPTDEEKTKRVLMAMYVNKHGLKKNRKEEKEKD